MSDFQGPPPQQPPGQQPFAPPAPHEQQQQQQPFPPRPHYPGQQPHYPGQQPHYPGQQPQGFHPQAGYGQLADDEKMWAMLAHFSFFVLGIIGPVLILSAQKSIINRESAYLTHHAKQALWWQVAAMVIGIVTCGIGALVMMVWAIIAGLAAQKGDYYTYPMMSNVGQS